MSGACFRIGNFEVSKFGPHFDAGAIEKWACGAAKVAAFIIGIGALAVAAYYSGALGAHLLSQGHQTLGGIVLYGTACFGLATLATPLFALGILGFGTKDSLGIKSRSISTITDIAAFGAVVVALPLAVAVGVVLLVAAVACACCMLVGMGQSTRY